MANGEALARTQTLYMQTEYTWYATVLQNISTGVGLFWDDFPQKKILRDLDPPTHFHSNLGFFSLQSPLSLQFLARGSSIWHQSTVGRSGEKISSFCVYILQVFLLQNCVSISVTV